MKTEPSPLQRRLLAALGLYRLLNIGQMVRVGVGKDRVTVGDSVRMLTGRGLVRGTDPRPIAGCDKLPALYWLTERGAALSAELNPDQPAPRGARYGVRTYQHIKHRMIQVETHIALRRWAAADQVPVGWFVTDFERHADEPGRATTIRYSGGGSYTCDALAEVAAPDGSSRLVAFEIERGSEQQRLTPFRHKLNDLRAHAESNLVSRARGIEAPTRFAIVFQSARMRDLARASWPDPRAGVWGQFFIKSADELADFNAGWWYPGGRVQRPLFSWATAAQPPATPPLPAA